MRSTLVCSCEKLTTYPREAHRDLAPLRARPDHRPGRRLPRAPHPAPQVTVHRITRRLAPHRFRDQQTGTRIDLVCTCARWQTMTVAHADRDIDDTTAGLLAHRDGVHADAAYEGDATKPRGQRDIDQAIQSDIDGHRARHSTTPDAN